MFNEMVQLPRTAVDLLDSGDLSDIDWRGWYRLYLDVEKFIGAAASLLQYLENGPEELLTSDPERRYVDSCNDSFSALHGEFSALLQSVFGLMRRASRAPGGIGSQAQLISHHCHPKSYWKMCWDHVCFTGRVSADATRLDRQVLRMHPAPSRRMMERDIIEPQLYQSESIDISNAVSRKEAATAASASLEGWTATHRMLRRILRERCAIGDLVP